MLSVSEQKIHQCWWNRIRRVQRYFPKKFSKSVTVSFFRTLSKVFGASPNIFLQDCQNCFLCVQRTFMGQRLFLIENLDQFASFSDFERNQFDFSWKNSDILVKIAFHMSRETFRGFFFRKICACSFFCFLMENWLNFYRKKFELLPRKNPTALSKWNCTYLTDILWNFSFTIYVFPSHFDIERKVFGLLTEIFLSGL